MNSSSATTVTKSFTCPAANTPQCTNPPCMHSQKHEHNPACSWDCVDAGCKCSSEDKGKGKGNGTATSTATEPRSVITQSGKAWDVFPRFAALANKAPSMTLGELATMREKANG